MWLCRRLQLPPPSSAATKVSCRPFYTIAGFCEVAPKMGRVTVGLGRVVDSASEPPGFLRQWLHGGLSLGLEGEALSSLDISPPSLVFGKGRSAKRPLLLCN